MRAFIEKILTATYPQLAQKSIQQIEQLCETEAIPAGAGFIETGKPNHYEYIVQAGVVRSYLLNQDGDPVTLSFFEEGCILSPHVTRTQQGRALINFEAITDCTLVRFGAAAFERLIEENLEIREFANTVLRQELFRKINKEIRLISWTAKARLEQFREDYNMLENRVPHTMIASYLGITNVSLSRLRAAEK